MDGGTTAAMELRAALDAAKGGSASRVPLGDAGRVALAEALAWPDASAALWMLEFAPDGLCVAVAPRATPGPVTVSELMLGEHERLDALGTAMAAIVEGSGPDVLAAWNAFAAGLTRHIRVEESVLFPLLEPAAGPVGGPTTLTRIEHRALEHLLELGTRALARCRLVLDDSASREAFLRVHRQLGDTLRTHHLREDQELYPLADGLLTPERRDAILRRTVLF